MRKLRLKEMAKPVWFYAKFDEEWRVEHHGKSDWAKRMCSTQQTVGNLATPVCSDAFWHPLSLEIKMPLPSGYGERTSQMKV